MRLRQLFESPATAVMAFGRMNPPTIGHKKLVDKIKSLPGDPYVFLSQSQKPKTDPLAFQDKLRYAKFFFPDITIGNPEVRTIIQALQKINSLGYKNLIYVAGSDRVQAFEEMINKYNGVEYNFDNIQIVSAGERDPDADGAEGMSASKMRAAALAGDLESFKQGVPNPEIADEMFAAVRQGMGVKDTVPAEGQEIKIPTEDGITWQDIRLMAGEGKLTKKTMLQAIAVIRKQRSKQGVAEGSNQHISPSGVKTNMDPSDDDYDINYGKDGAVAKFRKAQGMNVKTGSKKTKEAAYEGNLGLMELFKFFNKAEKTDPQLVTKVKQLIKQGEDRAVWKIVQDYTETKLVGKQFECSIAEAIIERACKMKRKSRG
jgi:hypothetical protein